MKKFLILAIILFSFLLLLGGYFGVIPHVSSLFGSDRPRNLGVSYTKIDLESQMKKAGYVMEISNNVSSPLGVDFSGQVGVKETFTPGEISARLNYAQWKYMPIANVQVNFPEKDTVEFSANLLIAKIPSFLKAVGFAEVNKEDIEKSLGYLRYSSNPPVYAKARVVVLDNDPQIEILSAQVGRLSVPFDGYDVNSILELATKRIFSLIPGFYAKRVEFSPSGLYFEGTAPAKGIVLK